jgi:nucleoside-triphosphatase THEP1
MHDDALPISDPAAPDPGGGQRLAAVGLPGKGETDRFLTDVVARLEAMDLRLAGTVQTNLVRADRPRCDMDLRVLPDGPILRISEDRGAEARGCRLDSGALEQTVVEVGARLSGADLLVLNKFGKREAEGRGFVPVIAQALDLGVPVLVGVNVLNLPALRAFAQGLMLELPADIDAVLDWVQKETRSDRG